MSGTVSSGIWYFLMPSHLLPLAIVFGWVLSRTAFRRLGRCIVAVAAVLLILAATLPVGDWLIRPLEARFYSSEPLPEKVDGIVVLSGAELPRLTEDWELPQVKGHGERLIEAASLAAHYPRARVVFSGGGATDQGLTEAEVARRFFSRLGIAADRLELETKARNTYENATNAYRLAKPQPDEVWLLVTSAFHMPRAVACFRAAGWRVTPRQTDYKARTSGSEFEIFSGTAIQNLRVLDLAVHEWIGLLYYRLQGRTLELFPAPRSA